MDEPDSQLIVVYLGVLMNGGPKSTKSKIISAVVLGVGLREWQNIDHVYRRR
jgi:hypothetical protein